MKYPFLASLIVFVIWLSYEFKKSRRLGEKGSKNFWEKEAQANSIRKKSLEHLNYIQIPYETFSFSLLSDIPEVKECQDILLSLQDKKIVNLTGISNTDLKFQYGAANLPVLTEYDQNYTLLARTLQKLAEYYAKQDYKEEAVALLEFAVSTITDVSGSYRLLAALYTQLGDQSKIASLVTYAEQINGIMKNSIVRTLQEFYPYNG